MAPWPSQQEGAQALHRSITIVSLLVALAVLFTAMPTAARSKIALGVSDPKRGALEEHLAEVQQYYPAHLAPYKPAMWSLWSSWGSRDGTGRRTCLPGRGSCYFPVEEADQLMQMGITPVVWWQPTDDSASSKRFWSDYGIIASGRHDKYIRQWARALKSVAQKNKGKGPILVRFAHENAGGWFPWSLKNWSNNPAKFKRAWRHIVKLFRKERVFRRHVRFVWSNYLPRKKSYPGDKWVDYIGITILNFGAQKKWKPMPGQVRRGVRLAKKVSRRKPVMLAEVASHYKGGNKARWIRNGYLKTYRKFPKVKAILYLDTNQPAAQGRLGHPDWRLVQPPNGSALAAYANIAKRKAFQGHIPKR
jgi:hypothetical protein